MKTILATTAFGIAMTVPVFAEQTASGSPFMSEKQAQNCAHPS